MKSIALVCVAAGSASLSNYFIRKNSVANYSTNAYLLCYYVISFVVACLIFPEVFTMAVNPLMLAIGGIVGVLNILLMYLTTRALERGPAGLTFAFQNGGAIFPVLILFLVFGEAFGFTIVPIQIIGMGLVIAGLWLGSKNQTPASSSFTKGWFKYALGCFFLQMFTLTLFHWRCLLFSCNLQEHILIPTTISESADAWFMPGFFGVATILQALIFLKEKRWIKSKEILYGSIGGASNGVSTFLIITATKIALPIEKSILFPCFAVAVIIFCSAWGYKVYGERINLAASATCALGIIVAALA